MQYVLLPDPAGPVTSCMKHLPMVRGLVCGLVWFGLIWFEWCGAMRCKSCRYDTSSCGRVH